MEPVKLHKARLKVGADSSGPSGEVGQILIGAILFFTVFFVIGVIVVDVGLLLTERRRAHSAADLAALAAVPSLYSNEAEAVAAGLDYAERNAYDDTDPDVWVTVNIPPSSGNHLDDSDFVEVIVEQTSPALFLSIFGITPGKVGARAVAGASDDPGAAVSDASIIALDPDACFALVVNAGKAFTSEGPILINSDCDVSAAEFGCSVSCKALGGIDSVGGVEKGGVCDPCNVTTIPQFADPLADVLPPCFLDSPAPCQDVGGLIVRHGSPNSPELYKDDCEPCLPGIYYGGMDLGLPEGTLAPGIYIMAGGGFKVNSSGGWEASEVFIYNTNDPTCPGCSNGKFGGIHINTNSAANFSGMTTGPYAGLVFFQDRENAEEMVINNNGTIGEGTIYAPAAHLQFNPNGDSGFQLIANTIKINNSAPFTALYDGDKVFQGSNGLVLRLYE